MTGVRAYSYGSRLGMLVIDSTCFIEENKAWSFICVPSPNLAAWARCSAYAVRNNITIGFIGTGRTLPPRPRRLSRGRRSGAPCWTSRDPPPVPPVTGAVQVSLLFQGYQRFRVWPRVLDSIFGPGRGGG